MPAKVRAVNTVDFDLPHGDGRPVAFNFRNDDSTGPADLADAESIVLRWQNAAGEVQEPLVADPDHPDADWGVGRVVFTLTPDDILADATTVRYSVAGVYDSVPRTLVQGSIQVSATPGYPPPT